MSTWEKYSRIISSLGMFALGKTLGSMIVPIIAKWDWAVMFPDPITTKDLMYQPDHILSNITMITTECQNTAESHLDPLLLVVFLVVPITGILVSPVIGVLGDTLGNDLLVLIGIVDMCVVSALFASSSSFSVVVTARILLGLGSSIMHLNALGRVFQVVKPNSQESNTIIGLFLSLYSFQFFLPGIFGIIFKHYGQVLAFTSLIPIEVILGASVVSTYQFKNKSGHKSTTETRASVVSTYQFKNKSGHKSTNRNTFARNNVTMWTVVSDIRILILSCVIAISWLPKTCLEPVLSVWLQQEYSGDTGTTSMIWGVAGFSVLAACFVSIYCMKYCSHNHLLVYTTFHFALSTVPIALLPHMSSPPGVAICFTLSIYFASAGRYGAMCILAALAEEELDQAFGKVLALANIGFATPYLLAPLIAIPLYNNVGFRMMCVVIAPLSVLFAPMLHILRKERKDERVLIVIQIPDYEEDLIKMEAGSYLPPL